MDLDRYLARIGHDGPRAPTLETLAALQRAHLMAVPFENLSIHLREPIELDEDWLFDKIVVRRRGGFCYELNGLFAAALRAIGFEVDRLAARVFGEEGQLGIPFDHMTLRVRLDQDWLVDVGFGDSFIQPLPLVVGEHQDLRRAYRLRAVGPELALDERRDEAWKPQYQFALAPHALSDFEPGCRHHSTSPRSPFTQRRICSRLTPTGRLTLTTGKRIVTALDGHKTETAIDDATLDALLASEQGIHLA